MSVHAGRILAEPASSERRARVQTMEEVVLTAAALVGATSFIAPLTGEAGASMLQWRPPMISGTLGSKSRESEPVQSGYTVVATADPQATTGETSPGDTLEPMERSAPMDYQERYLDMLQKSVESLHDDFLSVKDELRQMRTEVKADVTAMRSEMNGQRWASWSLVGVVGALVVATVIGIIQFAAQMFALLPHK